MAWVVNLVDRHVRWLRLVAWVVLATIGGLGIYKGQVATDDLRDYISHTNERTCVAGLQNRQENRKLWHTLVMNGAKPQDRKRIINLVDQSFDALPPLPSCVQKPPK